MTDKSRRSLILGVLILTTVCFGALLIPAGLAIMMAPMAFDAGISASALLFVGCLVSFPLVVLVSIPASWILYRRGTYRAAILLGLLPAVNILVLAIMFSL